MRVVIPNKVRNLLKPIIRAIASLFYTPEGFTRSWAKIEEFAREAGRDPAQLDSVNQLPIVSRTSVHHGVSGPSQRPFFGQTVVLQRVDRMKEGLALSVGEKSGLVLSCIVPRNYF